MHSAHPTSHFYALRPPCVSLLRSPPTLRLTSKHSTHPASKFYALRPPYVSLLRTTDMDTLKPSSEPMTCEESSKVDYTIQVEGCSFPVHKDAMVALSDYFQTMLIGSTQMAESQKDVVVIEGISADVMELLLNFVYKKHLDVTTENATEVLAGAMYLQMKPAINVCTEFMVNNIDTENWHDVFSQFKMYNLIAAIDQVKDYIGHNMEEVLMTLDFKKVEYDGFSCVVDNWRSTEPELLALIQQWLNADYDKRRKHLDNLLSCVRYGLMKPVELKAARETKEIRQSPAACQLIDNALRYHRLPMHQKVLDTSVQTRVRGNMSFVNCVPAEASYLHNCNGEIHVIRKNELKFPDKIYPYVSVEVNNFIVVGSAPLNMAVWHMLDPRTSQWTEIAQLPRRFLETVIVSDGRHIYALGGYDLDEFSEVMRDIDRYDFQNNSWSDFNVLPVQMVAFGACIIGNELYISGGQSAINRFTQGPPPFSRMDCLNLITGKWQNKPKMLKPRSKHKMSVMKILGDEVCCIIDSELNIEYYSPTRQQWSRCPLTFSQPLSVRKTENMLLKGNVCFLYNICVSEEEEDSEYICMELNIPENGTEVAVKFIYKYGFGLTLGKWFALSLPPYNKELCGTAELQSAEEASATGLRSDTGGTQRRKKQRRRKNGKKLLKHDSLFHGTTRAEVP